jgi:predicted O-methyltransferase YrrM
LKSSIQDDLYLASHYFFDLLRLYLHHANNEVAYYNLLFSIAISAGPITLVELGTGPGLSSLAFIRALQYHNRRRELVGVLHTCDMNAAAIEPIKRFGTLVEPYVMTTDALATLWAKKNKGIDLLYIDADHSHEQSLADFDHFSPFVNPNGLILMHDTFPLTVKHEELQYSGTVYKTAQYIKSNYQKDFEIMTFPYLCGISLLRRAGAKYY